MVIRRPASADRVFRALADPTRRRILEQLARRDHAVGELVAQFDISQPAVTKHLNVLAEARLVTRRKRGRERVCRIEPAALQHSADWIDACRSLWTTRLDALESLMTEIAAEEEAPDATKENPGGRIR
jgi:DNA-binding transcriptional ArsR family regulator